MYPLCDSPDLDDRKGSIRQNPGLGRDSLTIERDFIATLLKTAVSGVLIYVKLLKKLVLDLPELYF